MFGGEKQFQPGDWVVYCKSKHSAKPGPRAKDIDPEPRGETYTYHVDKYWVVTDVTPEGELVVRTRRGKEHVLSPDDPNLRHALLYERLLKSRRFPRPELNATA